MFSYLYNHIFTHQPTLIDLDEECLFEIFRNLTLQNLASLRATCSFLNKAVGDYLAKCDAFTYTCRLNGVELSNGQYQFNLIAFESALKSMPNLRILSFERCSVMKSILATAHVDIMDMITNNLAHLKELHISRSLAINQNSIALLVAYYPKLTHLTMDIFNEKQLEMIIEGLDHLKYLNLGNSILTNYGTSLRKLSSRIKTFIAPYDYKNEKMFILKNLCEGKSCLFQNIMFCVCLIHV